MRASTYSSTRDRAGTDSCFDDSLGAGSLYLANLESPGSTDVSYELGVSALPCDLIFIPGGRILGGKLI